MQGNIRASTYTKSSVQLADAGSYSVVVTNLADSATSSNAVLTVAAPPAITTQPQSQVVNQSNNVSFTVSASGTAPLSYQWRWYGTNLAGATGTSLALTGVTTNQAGPYTALVTNTYGAVTSQVAMLTVTVTFQAGGLTQLWSLAPYSRPYLTTNQLPYERGLAYNVATKHVLVVSRTAPSVYVLDADTGADLYQLSVSGVSGGTYSLLMIGAADDGAVYAGNLTSASSTTSFTLYRWANDSSTTVPTVAYSGNPTSGNSERYGDTLDVCGAGTNTQVMVGSRSSTNVVILTTTDGTNFTAKSVIVADASAGSFGLGVAFGASNTCWGKAANLALRQVTFNLGAGTGSSSHVYADPVFPNAVSPIGVSTPLNLLAGISVGVTNNHLRLYDLSPTLTNGAPALIATNAFATDHDDSYTGSGSVDFGGDRVYALCPNNGIIALQIIPAVVNNPPVITLQPQPPVLTVNVGQSATFTVSATGTPSPTYQWRLNGTSIPGATATSCTRTNVQPADAGSYSVVVTNIYGYVTSSNSILIVNVPPAITVQPQDQTVNQGASASFAVNATGTAPLSFQWLFNGNTISGATDSGYTLPAAQTTNAGAYSVVVTNMAGSVTSSNAMLTVNAPPAITTQPQNLRVMAGRDAAFSVTATGTSPLSYQWQFNTANIPGATGSSLTRNPAQTNDAGFYCVVVTNVAGSVTSSNAMLIVTQPNPPHIDSIRWLPDGQIQLQVSGDPGNYAIEAATNLADWAELTNFTTTNPAFPYTDPETNLTQRFYRARLMP